MLWIWRLNERFVNLIGMSTVRKYPGNPNWGGTQKECKVIQKRADEWCKENGYPIQRSKYWKKRKWTRKKL